MMAGETYKKKNRRQRGRVESETGESDVECGMWRGKKSDKNVGDGRGVEGIDESE